MTRINYLLDSIDNGQVVLPEFQRGYVWSRDQVKGLFQSLYQKFPVGGLLIWNTTADTTPIRGSNVRGPHTVKLLLDGQQRVTSLYGVMRGRPPEFFEDPQKAKSFTDLYFNVDDERFEFYSRSTMANDPRWVSVSRLFLDGPEEVLEEVSKVVDLNAFACASRLSRLHGIGERELHEENLGSSMTVDVVVDIFNRVNSGGTKLSKGDLALARICAIREEARAEIREALATWSEAGYYFKSDWLLRCVNIVATGEALFGALKDISSEDFGVSFKRATRAVDFLLNLLASRLGVDHDRILQGKYGLAVLARLVADQGGTVADLPTQNKMLYWYLHQSMWGRYSGSTESTLNKDLEALDEGGVDGLIREMERVRGHLRVRPEDFDTHTMGSRFYPVLYILTRMHDSQDLCSGLRLSHHLLGSNTNLEVHHVFPKSLLYEKEFSRSDVNAIGNFTFLTADCNKTISNTSPDVYLPRVQREHPDALASHWISDDPGLWSLDAYLDFLTDRRQRLAAAANSILDGLLGGEAVAEIVRSPVVVEDDDDDPLVELSDWCAELGLSRPEIAEPVVDQETGEPLVYPDAHWPEGMQQGMSEQVALLIESDNESEERLGELGYRFFTTTGSLRHYVEELLNIDLDGDGIVGAHDSAENEAKQEDNGTREPSPSGTAVPGRRQLLAGVYGRIGEQLRDQGWMIEWPRDHKYIALRFPAGHALAGYGYHTLRSTRSTFTFRQVVENMPGQAAAAQLIRFLHERHGATMEQRAPDGTTFDWLQLTQINARWMATHPRGGWADLDIDDAASWGLSVATSWMDLCRTMHSKMLFDRCYRSTGIDHDRTKAHHGDRHAGSRQRGMSVGRGR